MTLPLKVYIAGPYTIGNVDANVRNAIEAGVQVIEAGHHPFVPHLSHFLHQHRPQPYETWIALDNAFLPCCDALVRLPGVSKGADAEVMLAENCGLPVYYSVAEFIEDNH